MKTKLILITLFTLGSSLRCNPFCDFLKELAEMSDIDAKRLHANKTELISIGRKQVDDIIKTLTTPPENFDDVFERINAHPTKTAICKVIIQNAKRK